jgi:integrase
MAKAKAGRGVSFRIGRVKAYRRGQIWYLYYFENGRRRRPRVGPDRDAAKKMAAQINGQLEAGAPAALTFEAISIPALRERWLNYHEQVRRSSLATISRYRTATDHLLRFLEQRSVRHASQFRVCHAEEFVGYLRSLRVAPNGHAHSLKRPLLDKGILFILEACRALFVFAAKRRHLPPYAENPFSTLELGKMPVDHRRPIRLPTNLQMAEVLGSADHWSCLIFATLALTGVRPGELVHLLVEDFDPQTQLLYVRNRPALGWQVKTRQDRCIPLLEPHAALIRMMLGNRRGGTLFQREKYSAVQTPTWTSSAISVEEELSNRRRRWELAADHALTRQEHATLCRQLWTEMGLIKTDRLRQRLRQLAQSNDVPELETPKVFRHLFATLLQEGRVDPLIRNELLGHIPEEGPRSGGGLGMTANYTQTRPETKRAQLASAFVGHPLQKSLKERVELVNRLS